MPDRMQQFIKIDGAMPDKRAAADRRKDFDEIYDEYSEEAAVDQASRCEQCGIPYCQVHCPLQNNIPDWLRLATEGRMEEAYQVSQATNTFPEVCGRICPQDRLCEGSCVLEQSRHGTVTIGAVEKHITDTAWKNGWVKAPEARADLGLSVGIIGGGPAGLAAADRLCTMGYQVHVYDRYDRMGGLLIYGIPNFKLEKDIVERRTKLLADGGVIYHTNFEVGRDASLADLRAEHDAVLIATGVYNARELQAPGAGLKNIFPAMDFLTASNRKGLGDAVPDFDNGTLNADGKDVVVIGGGDTAMDCVRTAVRQGAKSVKCLYRRDRANMPGSQREVANAEEEGVEFVWLSAPEAFLGDDKIEAVRAIRMHLGVADVTGRQTPEPIKDSSFNIEADIAIKALGFDPEDLPTLFGAPELTVTKWGTIKVNEPSKMTELEGVFAAGDIYRGASLVVWAIRDGREAADGIHQYLQTRAERADAA
ncbi:MAG: NAD(P)-dependent oxidoreductase [Rhodospirillales bacterium]|nr:NAD(P)-dependent oxidoreductase [Rhodospirillales bacterium]